MQYAAFGPSKLFEPSEIYSKNDKILVIGICPPPFGGVSVFLDRLFKMMRHCDYNVTFFDVMLPNKDVNDMRKYKRYCIFELAWFLLKGDFSVIHLHCPSIKYFLLLLAFKKMKKFKVFFTDYNPRLFPSNGKIKGMCYRWALSRLDGLIVVAEHILRVYQEHRVALPKLVFVRHCFLPPPEAEEMRIWQSYPKEVIDFIGSRTPFLIANASAVNFFQGTDLYGIDMCINVTAKLIRKYPNIGFVFALANSGIYESYLARMKEVVFELGLQDHFMFLIDQKEIWPLFKKANLMIRPTYSDGFSGSVVEALFLGCKTIASDVCERPDETLMFKNRDLNDLYEKILKILKNA